MLNHPRSSFFDYEALGERADEVLVMSWGLHWSTSAPGSVIDIRWYTKVYDYVSTLPSHAKFVLGAPLYSFDWAAGGGPTHPATALGWDALQALIARTGAVPIFDAPTGEWHFAYTDATGIPHEVWFSNAASLDTHLALAAPRGLAGIALWRSGQEDPAHLDDSRRSWGRPRDRRPRRTFTRRPTEAGEGRMRARPGARPRPGPPPRRPPPGPPRSRA